MTEEKLEAFLGRPLTAIEQANRKLYLSLAYASLEEVLCTPLTIVDEARVFDTQQGYRTVFTDVFTEIESVVVGDKTLTTDDYSLRQWNKRTGSWYNSIVLTSKPYSSQEVTITAIWGFDNCMPTDLESLVAGLFGLVSTKNTTNGLVQSKQVEDFRISFKTDTTATDQFLADNSNIIDKYSLCNTERSTSGPVCQNRCYGFNRF